MESEKDKRNTERKKAQKKAQKQRVKVHNGKKPDNLLVNHFTPKSWQLEVKIRQNCQISFYFVKSWKKENSTMWKYSQSRAFHLNSHTAPFLAQTQMLELPFTTPPFTLGAGKGLNSREIWKHSLAKKLLEHKTFRPPELQSSLREMIKEWLNLRACFRGGGGPQVGEVTCGRSPHLSCKRDQINI